MAISSDDAKHIDKGGLESLLDTVAALSAGKVWTNDASTVYEDETLDVAMGGSDSDAVFFYDYSTNTWYLQGSDPIIDTRSTSSTSNAQMRICGNHGVSTDVAQYVCRSPSAAGSGADIADSARMGVNAGIVNGYSLVALDGDISFYVGGTATTNEVLRLDDNSTAGNTRMMVFDVDAAALVRVSVGADDSGGAGYKLLRVPN